MSNLALGLMSGTSADGVSAVLASFKEHSFKLIGHVNVPYPAAVAARVRRGPALTAAEVSSLNVELGELFAQAALKVLKKSHASAKDVTCIGSHGQTIYHGPNDAVRNTLQIADPAVIAERTGIDVVSNFRQRDVAAVFRRLRQRRSRLLLQHQAANASVSQCARQRQAGRAGAHNDHVVSHHIF
jgi:anhydro-N-acetylmuramic acid kinase